VLSRLGRMLKNLYPVSEVARTIDVHFRRLDAITERIAAHDEYAWQLQSIRDSLEALRNNTATLNQHPRQLAEINSRLESILREEPWASGVSKALTPATVIVTANEVSAHHGTGILTRRLLGGASSVVSIRSENTYTGQQDFGYAQYKLPERGYSRPKVFEYVSRSLRDVPVQRVVCIPFFADDLLVALAVKEIFDVPLCLYIMDDQNLFDGTVPDRLMAEAIEKSSLNLAISTEMQHGYQNKFGKRFWVLPPLVSADLVRRDSPRKTQRNVSPRGILIGNMWSPDWLDRLRRTVRGTGVTIDWYCNFRDSAIGKISERALLDDGITLHDPAPEPELAATLLDYTFAIIPTTDGQGKGTAEAIGRYSLPSRATFIAAASHTPILVLGQPEACVSSFVSRFEVGLCCGYDPADFLKAAGTLARPDIQERFRANARRIAPTFSDSRIADWLFESIDRGEPADNRFEELLPLRSGEYLCYCDSPVPVGIAPGFREIYCVLRRLKRLGFKPDFVIDAGASTGIWSATAGEVFPGAQYVLIDALASRYEDGRSNVPRNSKWLDVAVADKDGTLTFQVSDDLYNSSLAHVGDAAKVTESVEVRVTTLDNIARKHGLAGSGMVKIDVQFAEHLVIEGAKELLRDQADVVVLELTLQGVPEGSKTFLEMLQLMDELGFSYWDDAGQWRERNRGVLEQKDAVFIRKGLFS